MKNFLLSLLACAISFGLTTYGLNKYGQNLLSSNTDITEEPTKDSVKENSNEPSSPNKTDITEQGEDINVYDIDVNTKALEGSHKKWNKYTKNNIDLSYDFIPIDINNKVIEKEDFLNKLKTGLYIPLKVESDEFTYKLHKLSESANSKIGKSIRGKASIAYSYFKKEGTEMPKFNFTDLNGNIYNSRNSKGKIKVIKCWFINCVVCVQEFPELNELYDRYESNENVSFLSLAFDNTDKLKKFLSRKEFRYPVIPEQKKYIAKKLGVKQYPTHLIVDEDNVIIKMVSNVDALTLFLDQIAGEDEFNMGEDEQSEEFE